MVKHLLEMCLSCIQEHLDSIPNVGKCLTTKHKEALIQRLVWHDKLTEAYMPHITYNLLGPSLTDIELYRSSQVTDTLLKQLESCSCNLQRLVISKCTNVTDEGILAVTRNQGHLQCLELRELRKLTSKGLRNIQSPVLERLSLKGCTQLNTQGVSYLLSRNPSIRVLLIRDLALKDVHIAFQCLTNNLEELDCQLVPVTDAALEVISQRCPHLKSLNAHGCNRISGEGLMQLSQGCPTLQILDLAYCSRLQTNNDCQAFWTLPTSLTELSLCGILLENETIFVECLQRLRSLKVVRLSGVTALNDDTLVQALKYIGKNLTELDLRGGLQQQVTDIGLQAIPRYCKHLQVLAISLLESVSGRTLIPYFQDDDRAAQVKQLLFSCKKLDMDLLWTVLDHCPNLVLLDVSGKVDVGDDVLFALADRCRNLTHIALKGCRQVTDQGVCELVRCGSLQSIVLSGIHNITDKSIFALANSCPYLEEIFLNGCAFVTPMSLRYLQDCCIKRLFIRYQVPNADPNVLMARNTDTGDFCPLPLSRAT